MLDLAYPIVFGHVLGCASDNLRAWRWRQVLVFVIVAAHGPGPHALSLLPADASALTLSSSRKSAGEAYERRHQPVPAPAPAPRFAPEKSGFAEAIQKLSRLSTMLAAGGERASDPAGDGAAARGAGGAARRGRLLPDGVLLRAGRGDEARRARGLTAAANAPPGHGIEATDYGIQIQQQTCSREAQQ